MSIDDHIAAIKEHLNAIFFETKSKKPQKFLMIPVGDKVHSPSDYISMLMKEAVDYCSIPSDYHSNQKNFNDFVGRTLITKFNIHASKGKIITVNE